MLRCALFIPLLLSVLPAVSAWDHIQFDITVFCNYENRDDYNLKVVWEELDTAIMNSADVFTKEKWLKPNTGRYSFTMDGALNGDEAFSAGYKTRATITHDCTEDKAQVKLWLTISDLCEIGLPCHLRVIKDLTNVWGVQEQKADAKSQDLKNTFPDFP